MTMGITGRKHFAVIGILCILWVIRNLFWYQYKDTGDNDLQRDIFVYENFKVDNCNASMYLFAHLCELAIVESEVWFML